MQTQITIQKKDYPLLTDSMRLNIVPLDTASSDGPKYFATLLNLSSSSQPMVQNYTADYLTYYGQNLVFLQLRAGPGGTPINLTCDEQGTFCQVKDDKPSFGKNTVPLYFMEATIPPIPAWQISSNTLQRLSYTPPADKGTGASDGSGGKSNGQVSLQFSMSANTNGAATTVNPPASDTTQQTPPPPLSSPAQTPSMPKGAIGANVATARRFLGAVQ